MAQSSVQHDSRVDITTDKFDPIPDSTGGSEIAILLGQDCDMFFNNDSQSNVFVGRVECFCKHVQLFKLQASNQRLPVETLCNDAFLRMLTEGEQGEHTCHADSHFTRTDVAWKAH